MKQGASVRGGQMGFGDLPGTLQEALRSLARDFHRKGVDLLLFGSFAGNKAWPTSDLDIAHSPLPDPETERELTQRMEDLPSIRPVDLVPLDKASPALREEIQRTGIPLSEL